MPKEDQARQALVDLIEAAHQASAGDAPLPKITPKKYGFDSDQEYWDYIKREAKKIPPAPK